MLKPDRPKSSGAGLDVAKLMIVEDNDLNRDLLSRRLARRGYQSLLAADGFAAIDLLKQHYSETSLILLDMNLPIQDGWTTCQIIKENPAWAHIPIIALTAHALKNDRERALIVGCAEYETKPIDFDRLISKIVLLTEDKETIPVLQPVPEGAL